MREPSPEYPAAQDQFTSEDFTGEPADRGAETPLMMTRRSRRGTEDRTTAVSAPVPPAQPPSQPPARVWEDEPLPAAEAAPIPDWNSVIGEPAEPETRATARRRASFLDTQTARIPAARGFRGLLSSVGIRMAPSESEQAERRDVRAVSQHWPGPRTISVVNGKGGANKTPTTVMLAAVFARNGGGPVLAWDNNETRGTLGWRTEQGPHDSTVMDLLPNTGNLLSPSAQSALLARFVHHQTEDKFDVLRSKPDVLASEQKITMADFDALHEVASKYFRLNLVDSGNDESAERWLRMIHHTDQLVIATTTVEEHAEAGALLLEALQDRGGMFAELATNAVVIVSQSDRNGTDAQVRAVAGGFEPLARATVTIPYDAALRKGQIRYGSLRPATQRAWLAAAAAVAEGLSVS
ncbi:ParA family protein [Arthrobacter gengyunqii]|uniref:ParA family protein n=1 Tax=Arthrobacter gengyunqii TaxID=2886940 RepID=A0A9X1LYS6_9MICC|nr:ParA family protein [Arthrobacter gengyunqii]MCC3268238.1 ParA family protein [Arthrobacter gengyunqii]UOY95645.1 ParA family protein [Arthrobacter gengyunqii]